MKCSSCCRCTAVEMSGKPGEDASSAASRTGRDKIHRIVEEMHQELNPDQQTAYVLCIQTDGEGTIRTIQGPPGTGKTRTLAVRLPNGSLLQYVYPFTLLQTVVHSFAAAGKRTLVSTTTNQGLARTSPLCSTFRANSRRATNFVPPMQGLRPKSSVRFPSWTRPPVV